MLSEWIFDAPPDHFRPAGKTVRNCGTPSSILSSATTTLKELAALIAKQNIQNAMIEGHTDSDGGKEYNLRLSRARAEAVRKWLIANEAGNHLQRFSAIAGGGPRCTREVEI